MKPKFIFFDLGNVFMTYDQVFSRVATELNLGKGFFESYDKYDNDAMIGKLTIPNIWRQVCLENNLPQNISYNIIKSWVSDYEIVREMHLLAVSLSAKYPLGVLSNLYLGFWQEICTQKFVPNVNFSPVIISAEVGYQKPQLEILQIAQEKSGFFGGEIFFIDDKQKNLDGAKQLGWQTFLFDYKNPQKSVDELKTILL